MVIGALILLAVAALLVLIAALRLVHPLPQLAGRSESVALPPTGQSKLDQAVSRQVAKHPGLTGVHLIDNGQDAFGVRRRLAQTASRSIDAQYYIWNGDLTGRLLLNDLLAAADRGIRVRLLIDDNPTAGLDAMWSAANSHENMEIRLFNPFTIRAPRSVNYLTDFSRINRRMHNKSFTVDSQVTVVGGRNIGDEYFEATDRMQFADMDVLAVGGVVGEVVREFDRYWASASAHPAERIMRSSPLAALRQTLASLEQSAEGIAYAKQAADGALVQRLSNEELDLEWVPAQLFSDDPAKGKGQIPRKRLVVSGLVRALGEAQQSLDVATAYFVPGRFGGGYLRRLSRSGRSVKILTNSLASTDVAAVHAGYAKYRRRLLRAKVRLYEMKPQLGQSAADDDAAHKFPRLGSSRSSLHAKLFLIDRKSLFIGSFNFDPRSVYLNCEMGLLIHSEKIGRQVGEQIDTLAARACFEPRLTGLRKLKWFDGSSSEPVAIDIEPESTWRQRMVVRIIGWLPVEWLL